MSANCLNRNAKYVPGREKRPGTVLVESGNCITNSVFNQFSVCFLNSGSILYTTEFLHRSNEAVSVSTAYTHRRIVENFWFSLVP